MVGSSQRTSYRRAAKPSSIIGKVEHRVLIITINGSDSFGTHDQPVSTSRVDEIKLRPIPEFHKITS